MACFASCRQVYKVDYEFAEHILYGTTVLTVLGVQQSGAIDTGTDGTASVFGRYWLAGRGY